MSRAAIGGNVHNSATLPCVPNNLRGCRALIGGIVRVGALVGVRVVRGGLRRIYVGVVKLAFGKVVIEGQA